MANIKALLDECRPHVRDAFPQPGGPITEQTLLDLVRWRDEFHLALAVGNLARLMRRNNMSKERVAAHLKEKSYDSRLIRFGNKVFAIVIDLGLHKMRLMLPPADLVTKLRAVRLDDISSYLDEHPEERAWWADGPPPLTQVAGMEHPCVNSTWLCGTLSL